MTCPYRRGPALVICPEQTARAKEGGAASSGSVRGSALPSCREKHLLWEILLHFCSLLTQIRLPPRLPDCLSVSRAGPCLFYLETPVPSSMKWGVTWHQPLRWLRVMLQVKPLGAGHVVRAPFSSPSPQCPARARHIVGAQ